MSGGAFRDKVAVSSDAGLEAKFRNLAAAELAPH